MFAAHLAFGIIYIHKAAAAAVAVATVQAVTPLAEAVEPTVEVEAVANTGPVLEWAVAVAVAVELAELYGVVEEHIPQQTQQTYKENYVIYSN